MKLDRKWPPDLVVKILEAEQFLTGMGAFTRSGNIQEEKEYVPPQIIGIDGEGYTDKETGKHLYTYMAACTKDALISDLYRPKGIHTKEAFDFLLSLPRENTRIVGYFLDYDRTMWLKDLPNHTIYALNHPEERTMSRVGPIACRCRGYDINLVNTKFSLRKLVPRDGTAKGKVKQNPYHTIWDVRRFYQSSFVKALRAWKIGSEEEVARIEKMKAKRGNFRSISLKEKEYCQSECMLLAQLVESLLAAHEDEGLALKSSMYGPGTTASLVLDKCGVKDKGANLDEEKWVRSAYFGGRFEASHVGPVEGPIYAYDIASAYPYALALLPCLLPDHGRWVRTRDVTSALAQDVACIRYRLHDSWSFSHSWGPLPHRLPDGNIVFPRSGAGGWAWSVELRSALKMCPKIELIEAYMWDRKCVCPPPFRDEVVRLFRRRLEIGKSTRGIVVKLALNSMYGKSVQHVGSGKYRCMVRGGLITARTRSMLLEAVLCAKDPWNVLELATDSIMSREPLSLPSPIDLGTKDDAKRAGKVELGSWEEKPWDGGVFLLRPGLRFPLGEGHDETAVAARGLGIRVLQKNRDKVVKAWKKEPMKAVYIQQPTIFHGSKSSIRKVLGECGPTGDREYSYVRDRLYGLWVMPKPRLLSYAPVPKRCELVAPAGAAYRMSLWCLPPDLVSLPYGDPKPDDEESIMISEQPDGGAMVDYV